MKQSKLKKRVKYISIIVLSSIVLMVYMYASIRYSFICKESFSILKNNPIIQEKLGPHNDLTLVIYKSSLGYSRETGLSRYLKYVLIGDKDIADIYVVMNRKSRKNWSLKILTAEINGKLFNLSDGNANGN